MKKKSLLRLIFQKVWIIILLVLWASASLLAQQPGSIDMSFNPNDLGSGNGDGSEKWVGDLAVQPDGKIIAVGSFSQYNGVPKSHICRLNTDGTLDASFTAGADANSTAIRTVVIQPDGKVLIGGYFASINGIVRKGIARLNADGTLDTSFDPGQGVYDVFDIALQPDGKVIIVGHFTSYNGVARNFIARVNSDGTLDATFNPGTGFDNTVYTTEVQPDGKILVGGTFGRFNGNYQDHFIRLNPDGSADTAFNQNYRGVNNDVVDVFVQPDGKIIIAGDFSRHYGSVTSGSINRSGVARINPDGTMDLTFSTSSASYGRVKVAKQQPDGKIIIGGDYTSTLYGVVSNRITRLNSDGSRDLSFNPGTGTGAGSYVYAAAVQADGDVILGGYFNRYNGYKKGALIRVSSSGALDFSFNPGSGSGGHLRAAAVQPNGRIVIGGGFTIYNGRACKFITRIHADGSPDYSFDPGTGANDTVWAVAVQPDGKLLVGGEFTSINGVTRNHIARLNADGSIDQSFNGGTGTDGAVYTIVLQPNGKAIIGGFFTDYNGNSLSSVARLNSDGTLDTSFNTGVITHPVQFPVFYTAVLQVDGKIILGGLAESFNGTPRKNIARLHPNGAIDLSFNPGTGANNEVVTASLQTDGKIVISGSFTSYSGTGRNRIARLNADGSLDLSFSPGTGANNVVWQSALQTDGKILLCGQFTSYNGTLVNRLARLNTDGTLDSGFNAGAGANATVYALTIQPDGRILLGGVFTSYNGTGRNRIVRIFGGTATATTVSVSSTSFCQGAALLLPYTPSGTFNSGNVFTAQLSDASGSFAAPVTIGTVAATTSGTISATIPAGTPVGSGYRIRVVSSSPVTTGYDNGTNLSVKVIPAVPTVSVASTAVCPAGQSTMTASSSTAGSLYYWYTTATGTSALASGATYTTPALSATATYYVAASLNGCASARAAQTILLDPLPTAPLAVNIVRCDTGSVTLTASGSPAGGSYRWYTTSTGGTAISGATGAIYVTPELSTTTTYYVAAVNSAGCESNSRTAVQAIINAVPTQPVVAATRTFIPIGGTSTLNVLSPVSGTTYSWSPAATLSASAGVSVVATPGVTTTYSAVATANGCTSAAGKVVVRVSRRMVVPAKAVSRIGAPVDTLTNIGFAAEAHPNPCNNHLTLELTSAVSGELQILITDVTGRKVAVTQVQVSEGKQEVYLDLDQHLPAAMYFLQLQIGSERRQVKLYKQ